MMIIPGISLPFTQPWEQAAELAKKKAGAPVLSARLFKRSVDARHKNDIRFVYSIALELEGDEQVDKPGALPVPKAPGFGARPVVAGFGPAGMFAALCLARAGAAPIVLERGGPVERRVKDVEGFLAGNGLNTESNVQFGEGGAGTFSDGKLTTRINDPYCAGILCELCRHGAPEDILTQARPHVGTDLLRGIVKSIRGEIVGLGGEVRFDTRLTGLNISAGRLRSVSTTNGELEAEALVLAPGHSARDTFRMLAQSGIGLSAKPFSCGLRIEHLQKDVDAAFYGKHAGHPLLPPAEYRHALKKGDRAVYTFCMCPGGLVVPAASEENTVVTNGMSEHARSRENANAALVVSVSAQDFGSGVFAGVEFQQGLERAAFIQGGGGYAAPVQDVGSFLAGKAGYVPGNARPSYGLSVKSGGFADIFPPVITKWLRDGIIAFERKQRGFAAPDAPLTGVETRTSSPIRINRRENRECAGIDGIYPCGEGAGYAGGIMSAAADGWRSACALIENRSQM